MLDLSKDGLTQRVIAEISGMSHSTISKHITRNKYLPLQQGIQKNAKYSPEVARQIIKEVSKNHVTPKLKKHCFFNFKGGTGKTSLCFQVSSLISLMGYNVLVVDADPQGHLSTSCGFSSDKDYTTIYDRIINNMSLKAAVKTIYKGYDCIPANLSLTRLDIRLNDLPKREEQIKKIMAEIDEDYDFIFIDMNPTIGLLNWNVINYSDLINIVCETQPYSLNALKLVLDDLDRFFTNMEIMPKKIHVIPNKYEDRASSSAESMTILRKHYNQFLKPDFAVRKSEEINTGAKIGKSLAFYSKKNSVAFKDILELSQHIVGISA